jgi:hypothetical protein
MENNANVICPGPPVIPYKGLASVLKSMKDRFHVVTI